MKRKIIGLAALLCVAVGAAQGHKDRGHYVSRMVEKLPEFHAMHVQGNIEVDFMQHPTYTVHASGPQRVLDAADLRVQHGEAVLNGKGDIAVSAYEALSAQAFGKGKIKYCGAPVTLEKQGNVKHIVQDKAD